MISHDRAQELISARMDAPLTPAEHRELQRHLAACDSCRDFVSQARRAGARSAGAAAAGAEPGRLTRRDGGGPGRHARLGLAAARSAGALFSRHGRSLRAGARGGPGRRAHHRAQCARVAMAIRRLSRKARSRRSPSRHCQPKRRPRSRPPSQSQPRPALRCERSLPRRRKKPPGHRRHDRRRRARDRRGCRAHDGACDRAGDRRGADDRAGGGRPGTGDGWKNRSTPAPRPSLPRPPSHCRSGEGGERR